MKTNLNSRIPKQNSTINQPIDLPNRPKSNLLAMVCLWLLLGSLGQAHAATPVCGTIVNGHWTKANSPYLVTCDILVAGLTVDPGVEVRFQSNYVFEVAGKLRACGTPDLPILFTATNTGWQGLFFNTAQPGCELAHCIIEKSVNSGTRIVSTSPSISDCIIRSNSVTVVANGGAGSLSMEAGGGGIRTDSFIVLENCIVTYNSVVITVTADTATAIGKGGGVYSTAPLALRNCTISSNSVSANGRGYFFTSQPNSVSQGGGVWSATNLTMQSCIIKGNSANADSSINNAAGASAVSRGGGVWCSGQSKQRNSILSGNRASATATFWTPVFDGGGTYISKSGSIAENCTYAFNTPTGLSTDTNTTAVLNSIFWANTTGQIVGTTNVTYSDIQGGFAGQGNISGNPIFLSSDDLIIVDGSPCVDRGSTNAAYNDKLFPPSLGAEVNDMGAHGGPGAGPRLRITTWPGIGVVIPGGVPGYNYLLQGSTNLSDWATVLPFQVAHVGDVAYFAEPPTNTLAHRFYKLNLAP